MIVGITGGIASGKTYCSGILERLGVPVYYSDSRAKSIMVESKEVRNKLSDLFGIDAYLADGTLNRAFLSKAIFGNKDLIKKMNGIVHPAVRMDFIYWAQQELKTSHYIVQESALLVETGSYKLMDRLIVVDAPEKERIKRVMKRDSVTREDVLRRINNQLSSEEKCKVAHYVVHNYQDNNIITKLCAIHFELMKSKR